MVMDLHNRVTPFGSASRTWKLFSSIFLLMLIVSPTEAIMCFTCHSTSNPACGDKFRIHRSDVSSIYECFGTCVKRRGKRRNGQVSRIEISRSCVNSRKEGCYDEVWNGIEQYTCACNTNFCNSSSPLSLKYLLLLLSLLMTLMCIQ